MSSEKSRAPRSQSAAPSPEGVPSSLAALAETLFGGSRNLRSSGKRPLTTKEADRFEALARKRHSSKVKSSRFEPVTISDEEEGDRDECTPGFDHNGPCFQIQPLAMISLGQKCIDPDPNTVKGALQRLENALKQTISVIDVRCGLYADLRPFLRSCLEDVRRVGGVQLALRCDQKLLYWDKLALRAERLAYLNLCNEVWCLIGEARSKIERDHRTQCILEQEAIAQRLHERQHYLQCAIADFIPTTTRAVDQPSLEDMKWESTDVHRAFSKTMQTLHELWYENDISDAALFGERLEEEARAQVEVNRAKELSDLRVELKSFTVLDCA